MIPQVRGFQGCYLDNHRNNWRCARAVRKRPQSVGQSRGVRRCDETRSGAAWQHACQTDAAVDNHVHRAGWHAALATQRPNPNPNPRAMLLPSPLCLPLPLPLAGFCRRPLVSWPELKPISQHNPWYGPQSPRAPPAQQQRHGGLQSPNHQPIHHQRQTPSQPRQNESPLEIMSGFSPRGLKQTQFPKTTGHASALFGYSNTQNPKVRENFTF